MMKNQIKVKQTENLDGHIVCKGRLVLIETNEEPSDVILSKMIGNNTLYRGFGSGFKNKEYYIQVKPIIISETESIEVGDLRLDYYASGLPADIREVIKIEGDKIYDGDIIYNTRDSVHKILTLPEQFSSETLRSIVDNELKDGIKVYIECSEHEHEDWCDRQGAIIVEWNEVKLTNNHIKLFPIKEEEKLYTKEEVEDLITLAFACCSVNATDESYDAKEDCKSWIETHLK